MSRHRTRLLASVSIVLCAGLVHPAGARGRTLREFAVTAHRYQFEPDRFEVDQGDHVRFVITATDTDHGFGIKKLHVDETIPQGETRVVELDADQAGTFEIRCTEYCGKGHKQMKAVLIVRVRGTN